MAAEETRLVLNRRWSRPADTLWALGLMVAVCGTFAAAFGAVATVGKVVGVLALGLAIAGALIAWRRGRNSLYGAGVSFAAALFTIITAGRPSDTEVILLTSAPRYGATEEPQYAGHLGVTGGSLGQGGSIGGGELWFHPGPLGFAFDGFGFALGANLVETTLVAALWDNAWYAGRVVAVEGDMARVAFVGWEPEWDLTVPQSELRAIRESDVPRPNTQRAAQSLGSTTPLPCALELSVFSLPRDALDVAFDGLTPLTRLFAQRLDAHELAVNNALPGVDAGSAFAIRASAPLRFDAAGAYYFGVASDGAAQLFIDDALVAPGAAVALSAGVHSLRLDYRHSPGPTMTLGLQLGTDPSALRTLDMDRNGVAQVSRDKDGSLRILLAEGVLFDFDKDELNTSAERALSAIFASTLVPAPAARVRIEGHTDNVGDTTYNRELSQRRADRVRGWLNGHGRADDSLSTQAFGERRPRVPNDTEAHRKANRRVELVVAPTTSVVSLPQGGGGPGQAQATATAPAAVMDLLQTYFRELNAGTFDANRYFEPNIERYITMHNTSTSAVNHYIRDVFPKQFKQHHFELQEGSLVQEIPGQYVFIERAQYTLAGKAKRVDRRVKVRIRVSPSGKLRSVHQFEKVQ